MQKTAVPLRERNRLDTWALIHGAASTMALSDGLNHTTVEAISESAGISKRTFFNYFPTKEDAILGVQEPVLNDDAVTAFRANSSADLFGSTVRLMTSVVRTMFPEEPVLPRRKELMEQCPELRKRMFAHVNTAETLVESVLTERYSEGGSASSGVTLDSDGATALLLLAGTVMRFTYRRDPSAAFSDGSAAVDESIEIFREAIQATL
ncbi:TetR/AcrR family transcriptional regulator [Arthrobacter cryoconiti]|uniref:TetR/AcrR family transcriptional regulator n=1 Tax=Arthrobacter cryoconiti TaxID=748907 RepID=A0ABV8R766_9MICC|nr:TetR family transcriptional regulator [Arthrobacter cryoconiti]MCC9066791.1 TetR/AcrR family transcriptional regulator [Arthrobacter cryoconiti]